jgi:hypothetical protein
MLRTMDIDEPSFSTDYHADLGNDPATGARRTELRTLVTAWADLDATPWKRVADKAAAKAAVRRYHDALVAINEMRADDREAALAAIGDLTGASFDVVVGRVEAAARRATGGE